MGDNVAREKIGQAFRTALLQQGGGGSNRRRNSGKQDHINKRQKKHNPKLKTYPISQEFTSMLLPEESKQIDDEQKGDNFHDESSNNDDGMSNLCGETCFFCDLRTMECSRGQQCLGFVVPQSKFVVF